MLDFDPEHIRRRGGGLADRFLAAVDAKFALGALAESRGLYRETISLLPKPLTGTDIAPFYPAVTRSIVGEELASAALWGELSGRSFAYLSMTGKYEYIVPAGDARTVLHVRHTLSLGATGIRRASANFTVAGEFTPVHPNLAEKICEWVEGMDPVTQNN